MPREYCGVCRTFKTLKGSNIGRSGHYQCPDCGTRLRKAKSTKIHG